MRAKSPGNSMGLRLRASLVLALVLGGCGSSDDPPGNSTVDASPMQRDTDSTMDADSPLDSTVGADTLHSDSDTHLIDDAAILDDIASADDADEELDASDTTDSSVGEDTGPPLFGCPEEMVLVDGGVFPYGLGNIPTEIKPFCLDRREVSAGEYALCADDGACLGFEQWVLCDDIEELTPNVCNPDRQHYPANWVNFFNARAYCEWAGKRLPSDVEWERSVRGDDGRPYPWGEEVDCSLAHYSRGPAFNECLGAFGMEDNMAPVDAYADVPSPYGTINQAGNAKEWVDPWNGGEPDGASGRARGGSWREGADYMVGVFGDSTLSPDLATDLHGFRCATSPTPL